MDKGGHYSVPFIGFGMRLHEQSVKSNSIQVEDGRHRMDVKLLNPFIHMQQDRFCGLYIGMSCFAQRDDWIIGPGKSVT